MLKGLKSLCVVVGTASALNAAPASASTVIPVESDFFTTAWSFGAPFVRDAGRTSIGVSTPAPFLTGGAPDFGFEETTYFTFNFNPGDFTGAVPSAVLEVGTVVRPFGTGPNVSSPFAISAHRVTGDPSGIDGALSSGAGSYIDFKTTEIGAVEDTVSVTGAGVVQWDITSLVNEWIANGDTNFDYSVAMTGRVGNPADTGSTGFFHAFVNSGEGTGTAARIIVVPEPASLGLIMIGGLLVARRRRNA
ncbi:MAG: PEP-CTERM sorting domain-containing protein [Planctomycetota bacterium]